MNAAFGIDAVEIQAGALAAASHRRFFPCSSEMLCPMVIDFSVTPGSPATAKAESKLMHSSRNRDIAESLARRQIKRSLFPDILLQHNKCHGSVNCRRRSGRFGYGRMPGVAMAGQDRKHRLPRKSRALRVKCGPFSQPLPRPWSAPACPSPTGFLHIGGARTAFFSWAYARRHGGQFILRIEDTDVARSTQEAVDGILQAMDWLKLGYDEGPFYQMQRMDRYKEVVAQMLAEGKAYRVATLRRRNSDAMREAQRERGEKPKYDGRWRPEPGKTLPEPPAGVQPVIRFAARPTASSAGTTRSRAASNSATPNWTT